MNKYTITDLPCTDRIRQLVDNLYADMPVIEADRAVLITESYMQSECKPMVTRRALRSCTSVKNSP